MNINKQNGISLLATALIFFAVGVAAMLALYVFRYGHLPPMDTLMKAVPNATQAPSATTATTTAPAPDSQLGKPVTIESGARHCVINGKMVYSDTECHQDAKTLHLQDTKGFVPVKKPEAEKAPQEEDGNDMARQRIEKAIDNSRR